MNAIQRCSVPLAVALAVALQACGSGDAGPTIAPRGLDAVEVATAMAVGEGVLTGEPIRVSAFLMSYADAQKTLTQWGAVFPVEVPDAPSDESPVWVVEILGRGAQPGPGLGREEECLDVRVIVLEAEREEVALFGKPGAGC